MQTLSEDWQFGQAEFYVSGIHLCVGFCGQADWQAVG